MSGEVDLYFPEGAISIPPRREEEWKEREESLSLDLGQGSEDGGPIFQACFPQFKNMREGGWCLRRKRVVFTSYARKSKIGQRKQWQGKKKLFCALVRKFRLLLVNLGVRKSPIPCGLEIYEVHCGGQVEGDIKRQRKKGGCWISGRGCIFQKAALRGDYTQIRRGSIFPNQFGTIERGGTSDRHCTVAFELQIQFLLQPPTRLGKRRGEMFFLRHFLELWQIIVSSKEGREKERKS